MNNGELIEELPLDKTTTHNQEQIKIANMLFAENEGTINVLAREMKEGLIICGLFILFESEYVNEMIRKFVPSANGSYMILIGVKSIMVVLLFYVIKNFSLARKNAW